MIRILLQGAAGRMGQAVAKAAGQFPDMQIVAGIDPAATTTGAFPMFDTLAACNVPADVLIDFSSPEILDQTLSLCLARSIPCVICTTGLTSAQHAALQAAACHVPVFQSENVSLGVEVLRRAVGLAAEMLKDACDIEIVEKHHRNKKDAPSGTALRLAAAASRGRSRPLLTGRGPGITKRNDEIGIHAVRGGGIVGEHDVMFCCEYETLTFSHTALSRVVFAQGALVAARWLVRQPNGLYSMEDFM